MISQLFEGKQSKELQCLANPEHKSLRSDAFRELVRCAQPIAAWSPWPDVPPVTFCCVCRQNLHIADGVTSVDEALLSYFSTERLDGDNQYACSRCNTKVDAETRFFISSPPVRVVVLTSRVARGLPSSPPPLSCPQLVLSIQLQRFVFLQDKHKMQRAIKVPHTLDISTGGDAFTKCVCVALRFMLSVRRFTLSCRLRAQIRVGGCAAPQRPFGTLWALRVGPLGRRAAHVVVLRRRPSR